MPALQRAVRTVRRVVPRGWSPVLGAAARTVPALRRYPARMADGRTIVVDLRDPTARGLFLDAGLPHEPAGEIVLRRVLGPGATFVDVGANLGYFATLAALLVGAEGTVVACEPGPAAAATLRGTARRHENVEVHAVAVGAQATTATFHVHGSSALSSFEPVDDPAATAITVPVRPLDDLLADLSRLDLLKVDVEGAELDVLEGARSTIARLTPVIYLEVLAQRPGRAEAAAAAIRAIHDGYAIAWVDQSGGPLLSGARSDYLLAVPPHRADLLAGAAPGALLP